MGIANKELVKTRSELGRRMSHFEVDQNWIQLQNAIQDILNIEEVYDNKVAKSVYESKMSNLDSAISAMQSTISNLASRLTALEVIVMGEE